MVAVWLSGSMLATISEVARRQAQSLVGCVTMNSGGPNHLGNKPPKSTQPSHPLLGRQNENQQKLGCKRTHHTMH